VNCIIKFSFVTLALVALTACGGGEQSVSNADTERVDARNLGTASSGGPKEPIDVDASSICYSYLLDGARSRNFSTLTQCQQHKLGANHDAITSRCKRYNPC